MARFDNNTFLPPWRKFSYSMAVLVRIFRHVPFPPCQQKFFLTVQQSHEQSFLMESQENFDCKREKV
jgi:hypothetical protein